MKMCVVNKNTHQKERKSSAKCNDLMMMFGKIFSTRKMYAEMLLNKKENYKPLPFVLVAVEIDVH
jgi:tartrate dehydratase beta subunit/fumarate hydratase class I family protein